MHSAAIHIQEIVDALEHFAPLPLQESYDNAGLLLGLTKEQEATGALLCLDVTEEVIDEAISLGYNLIIAHHPLIFSGIKKITNDLISRCLKKAIKNDIAIYAAHTNLDNAYQGVNYEISRRIGLVDVRALMLQDQGEESLHGGGAIGQLVKPMQRKDFLQMLKDVFDVKAIRYSEGGPEQILTVALCGGAGSFMANIAKENHADVFVTGEIKYHDFFGYEDLMLVALGHYESEQFTQNLFQQILKDKLPALKTKITLVNTNPIRVYK
ncbi:MAG: Nif3-like dinuclear metal center hexameric protein [Bacteroidaceae bacterium]